MNDSLISRVKKYKRLEYNGVPIYIHPDMPDWCIPTRRADSILKNLAQNSSIDRAAASDSAEAGRSSLHSETLIRQFLLRFETGSAVTYRGRAGAHSLTELKECWLHLTDYCDMNCRYCMFSSGPDRKQSISPETADTAINEALALGCRIFYFTGGEPLVYPGIDRLCRRVLAHPDTRVVLLTNGLSLPRHSEWLLELDEDRLHFQISLDGSRKHHDAVRGPGMFDNLMSSLDMPAIIKHNCTLSMTVTAQNVAGMHVPVTIAAEKGIPNVHYMWLFQLGKATKHMQPAGRDIVHHLERARTLADRHSVLIDNVESIKSQIFSFPGTRYDLSNAGWESLAVGPDGRIYPTPAMIGSSDMVCGSLSEGLERVWRTSSTLDTVRSASAATEDRYRSNPLCFFIGGGDIDHSFFSGGTLTGHDPYVPVYNDMALKTIADEAGRYPAHSGIGFITRMGERLHACGDDLGGSSLTHSNCVLSLSGQDGHALVKAFYSKAAEKPNTEIQNPVCYDEQEIAHIPHEARIRSYGCGSPVLMCDLKPGEVLVDLGSGTGIECFIGAKKVGPAGRVYGIDMADAMLSRADSARVQVARALGYDAVSFKKAILEELPLDDNSVDAAISNCVINLSPDKRKTFAEIFRILKPGGRIMISDICYDTDIPLSIRYSEKLRGECIGGAFREHELFGLLSDLQFQSTRIESRYPYRTIRGYQFYSLTYSARKPSAPSNAEILYRGPFAAVVTEEGELLYKGRKNSIALSPKYAFDDSVMVFDERGSATSLTQNAGSCCCAASEARPKNTPQPHTTGCMVCGEPLVYRDRETVTRCFYCGTERVANATCSNGHFVCDGCHAQDALSAIKKICTNTGETDMIGLLQRLRSQAGFPVHGPEHHALVPAVILTAYRNSGGSLPHESLMAGIDRGRQIPGGACGFMGACGAAVGTGIAFSVILEAHPLTPRKRRICLSVTADVLHHISQYTAARCCQRECFIALKRAAALSLQYLDVPLTADAPLRCTQHNRNSECITSACPLYNETGKNDKQ